jgi:hypothetical protein
MLVNLLAVVPPAAVLGGHDKRNGPAGRGDNGCAPRWLLLECERGGCLAHRDSYNLGVVASNEGPGRILGVGRATPRPRPKLRLPGRRFSVMFR